MTLSLCHNSEDILCTHIHAVNIFFLQTYLTSLCFTLSHYTTLYIVVSITAPLFLIDLAVLSTVTFPAKFFFRGSLPVEHRPPLFLTYRAYYPTVTLTYYLAYVLSFVYCSKFHYFPLSTQLILYATL